MVRFTKNNLTGEHVALIKKDKRSIAKITKAYEEYNLVTEQLIKAIKTKKKGKYRRAHYTLAGESL